MNDREYGAMLQACVESFQQGNSSMMRLVEDIESINESISDSSAQRKIKERWWTLEQVYAVEVLDRGVHTLPADAVTLVEESLRSILLIAGDLSRAANSCGQQETQEATASPDEIMAYWKVFWHHDFENEPVVIYSEIGEEGYETRKVEVFRDQRFSWANDTGSTGGAVLSEISVGSIEDVKSRPEFSAFLIDREQFNTVWKKATS